MDAPATPEEALAMIEQAALLRQQADGLYQQAHDLTVAAAQALPSLRATANVTQAFAATSSGITPGYLSQMENGTKVNIARTGDVLRALADHDARDDLARARGGTSK